MAAENSSWLFLCLSVFFSVLLNLFLSCAQEFHLRPCESESRVRHVCPARARSSPVSRSPECRGSSGIVWPVRTPSGSLYSVEHSRARPPRSARARWRESSPRRDERHTEEVYGSPRTASDAPTPGTRRTFAGKLELRSLWSLPLSDLSPSPLNGCSLGPLKHRKLH